MRKAVREIVNEAFVDGYNTAMEVMSMGIPGQNRGKPPKTPIGEYPGEPDPFFGGIDDTFKGSGDSKKGEYQMPGGGRAHKPSIEED